MHQGLGWIGGEVDLIKPSDPSLKIPHMGWNTLTYARDHALMEGFPAAQTAGTPISCIPINSRRRMKPTWWRAPIMAARSRRRCAR